ncbi:MAG: MFS transporter [Dehalococcoidales bacterium]|nr:MFS transporter [Dehalococcoidales bacterium]
MEFQGTVRQQGDSPEKHGLYYGYVIVLLSFLMMVLSWGIYYNYGVFFTSFTLEFGWSRAVTSGAFSASVLVAGLFGIFTGRISDRFGSKMVFVVCAVLLSMGYVLISQVHSAWQFYLIYIILYSAGAAGFWTPLVAGVARWFTGMRGLMTGIVSGGISFGTLVLPPVEVLLISSFGWRTTHIIIGLVILAAVMISVRFFRDRLPQDMAGPDGQERYVRGKVPVQLSFSLKEAIATYQFWIACFIYLCFGLIHLTIMVHIVPFATGAGISDMKAAVILSIIGGTGLAGRVGMGLLADRLRVKTSAIICLTLITCALVWLQFFQNLWHLYLFAVVLGVGYGGLSCLQSLVAAELYGLMSLGVITGIFSFSFLIGGGAGPVLAGFIYDISLNYQPAFVLCLVLAALALTASLALKPPVKNRHAGYFPVEG